jgi:hypothetical protein
MGFIGTIQQNITITIKLSFILHHWFLLKSSNDLYLLITFKILNNERLKK